MDFLGLIGFLIGLGWIPVLIFSWPIYILITRRRAKMLQSFKGYTTTPTTNEKEDLDGFVKELDHYIDILSNINGKVDYEPGYEQGYLDACVAIKNTIKSMLEKRKG